MLTAIEMRQGIECPWGEAPRLGEQEARARDRIQRVPKPTAQAGGDPVEHRQALVAELEGPRLMADTRRRNVGASSVGGATDENRRRGLGWLWWLLLLGAAEEFDLDESVLQEYDGQPYVQAAGVEISN